MEITNIRRNRNGGLDCDIDHPVYGVIPYTVPDTDEDEIATAVRAKIADVDLSSLPDYIKPESLILAEESTWVKSEINQADIELNKISDGHDRAIATEAEWKEYRNKLRNYIIDGVIHGERPKRPTN